MGWLSYIGVESPSAKKARIEASKPKPISYIPVKRKAIAERYLSYLKELHEYQKERRTTIENKNSQMVGQASIVASIVALFIPLLFEQLNNLDIFQRLILVVLFLGVMGFYLLSISHALQTLIVNKYKYPARDIKSVTKPDRKVKEIDFINSEIEDLVFIINYTTYLDNLKGENLIFSARCFKIGNLGFGLITLVLVVSALVMKKSDSEYLIKASGEIKLTTADTTQQKILLPKSR